MTMNEPATAGRGLRRWGGGLFWLGFLILIGSVVLLIVGVRNVNLDNLEFTSQGSATIDSEQFMAVQGSSANDCAVTSPSGVDLPQGPSSGQFNEYYFVSVIPVESGQHTVTCVEGASYAFIDEATVTSAGGGVIAVGAAFLGFLAGGFFALLGIILWFVGRSKRKNAILNSQQYNGGQYNNGPYNAPPPPGYSQ